jgi:hypothetical protein
MTFRSSVLMRLLLLAAGSQLAGCGYWLGSTVRIGCMSAVIWADCTVLDGCMSAIIWADCTIFGKSRSPIPGGIP